MTFPLSSSMCLSEGAGALTLSYVILHQPQIFRPMLIFGTTRNRSIDIGLMTFFGGKEQLLAIVQNVAFFLIRNRQAALATGSYTSLKPGISLQIMQPFTSNLATGLPKTKPRNIDFRPNTQGSLAWLVAGRNMLGGGSLWYWTDCNHTNFVRGCPFSCTGSEWLGQLPRQLTDRSSVISGELQAGENNIHMFKLFIFDLSALMTPQKATLESFRTLSCFVFYRRLAPTFSVCFYSRYLSRWSRPRLIPRPNI